MKPQLPASRTRRAASSKKPMPNPPQDAPPVEPTDSATAARQAVSGPARDELIRLAAYSIYESRGGAYGHALEDWLQAEAMVDQANGRPDDDGSSSGTR